MTPGLDTPEKDSLLKRIPTKERVVYKHFFDIDIRVKQEYYWDYLPSISLLLVILDPFVVLDRSRPVEKVVIHLPGSLTTVAPTPLTDRPRHRHRSPNVDAGVETGTCLPHPLYFSSIVRGERDLRGRPWNVTDSD